MRALSERALMISTTCCWATDSQRTGVRGLKLLSPTSSSSLAVSRSIARRSTIPRLTGSRPTKTFSATLRSGSRLNSW